MFFILFDIIILVQEVENTVARQLQYPDSTIAKMIGNLVKKKEEKVKREREILIEEMGSKSDSVNGVYFMIVFNMFVTIYNCSSLLWRSCSCCIWEDANDSSINTHNIFS
jgi:hypothetical protein